MKRILVSYSKTKQLAFPHHRLDIKAETMYRSTCRWGIPARIEPDKEKASSEETGGRGAAGFVYRRW